MAKIDLPTQPELYKIALQTQTKHKELDLKAGLIGKLFGSRESAPTYIAGLCLFFLLFLGTIVIFKLDSPGVQEFWKIIAPIMTLIMGYLLGGGKERN